MSFAAPGYLALLALAPLAAVAYLALARWRRRAAERFAPGRDPRELSPTVSAGRRALKAALVVLALAAVAVALAGPRLGTHEAVVRQEGADVVVALDVSRSMLAEDVSPSRLAVAQRKTLALLDRLRGHRVGLVIFARSALLRAPLTADVAPVRALVRSAQRDSALLIPGSDVGAALRSAAGALEGGEAEGKAIVLVSDGEDHEGDALAAAEDVAGEGVALYAVGVGTEAGAPVPAVDLETGLPVVDGQVEAPEISGLDEGLLRALVSSSAQGRYRQAEELSDLAGVIDALERTPFASERREQPIERFQWFVLAALALLTLEVLVPERRGSWGVRLHLPRRIWAPAGSTAALVLLALVGFACGSSVDGLLADGNRAYERGAYDEALEAYRRAGALAPDRPEPHLNAGLALHRLGRYEAAARETARALPIDDPLIAARVHYNLGNHYVMLGRLADALDSYREALLLSPNDRAAKHNLELVLELIEAQRAQGPSDPATGDVEVGPEADADEGAPSEGEGQAGAPDADELGGRAEAAERSLEDALAGIEEEVTVEEALRILDLVQELNRLRPAVQPQDNGGPTGYPDY